MRACLGVGPAVGNVAGEVVDMLVWAVWVSWLAPIITVVVLLLELFLILLILILFPAARGQFSSQHAVDFLKLFH